MTSASGPQSLINKPNILLVTCVANCEALKSLIFSFATDFGCVFAATVEGSTLNIPRVNRLHMGCELKSAIFSIE